MRQENQSTLIIWALFESLLAGEEGIEPSYGGFKGPCLTAWLLPKVSQQLTENK